MFIKIITFCRFLNMRIRGGYLYRERTLLFKHGGDTYFKNRNDLIGVHILLGYNNSNQYIYIYIMFFMLLLVLTGDLTPSGLMFHCYQTLFTHLHVTHSPQFTYMIDNEW